MLHGIEINDVGFSEATKLSDCSVSSQGVTIVFPCLFACRQLYGISDANAILH